MPDGFIAGANFRSLIDPAKGTVDRKIFSDEKIYALELERIFARAWNFMCHESQIPKPGDFFLSFIGDDSVIATRDKKNQLQVLLNTCRHRGNAVCRAEQGHANSFLCTYHGWTYGLDGKLIGVPGFKDFYHEDLDRSRWGLIAAPKVASYKGFVFACMDADAPDLEDYLGPVGRHGLDLIAARGDIVTVDGVQKNIIGCNWKLAVDNIVDWYHPQISHASAMMPGVALQGPKEEASPEMKEALSGPPFSDSDHRVMMGDYGHIIGGPRLSAQARALSNRVPEGENPPPFQDHRWRDRPHAKETITGAATDSIGHPNIFPNFWITSGFTQACLRLPRGPNKTELWWFTFTDKSMSKAEEAGIIQNAIHIFGPAGYLEQDDGENWDQSTRATKSTIARRYPLNFGMNVGRGVVKRDNQGASYVDTHVNEHAQLWLYRSWADWMDAPDWAALKRDHTAASMEKV